MLSIAEVIRKRNFALLFFLVCLVSVFVVYLPGINGALYYDDFRPLAGLAHIDNAVSIINYIFMETSGPLGRPVSMLSFALQASDWPDNIPGFLLVNVLLHVTNAVLLALVIFLLLSFYGELEFRAIWIAIGTALLWLVMPLQVSTSLIVVQRMAGLSAFFVLLGLCAYLKGVAVSRDNRRLGVFLQILGIAGGTLMAALSKENGILLPVFVLVIEMTLLAHFAPAEKFRKARVTACSVVLVVVLGYLVLEAFQYNGFYPSRDFSVYERVLTQSVILFDYLWQAFFPQIYNLHPFHDGYPVVRSFFDGPKVILSVLFLFFLFVCAVIWRSRFPVFSFCVLWFMTAHALESTTVGLELYFEHRNYLALLGPCLFVVWCLSKVGPNYSRIVLAGFCAYIVVLIFILAVVTRLWGDKIDAAETWFVSSYQSARAAEHLALLYIEAGRHDYAYQVLRAQVVDCPNCIGSVVQAMLLACVNQDVISTYNYYRRAIELAATARNIGSSPSAISSLIENIEKKICVALDYEQVELLNTALLQHQTAGIGSGAKKALHVNQQKIEVALGNMDGALDELILAWRSAPENVLAQAIVRRLNSAGRFNAARDFVENEVCADFSSWHPYRFWLHKKECSSLRKSLDEKDETKAH